MALQFGDRIKKAREKKNLTQEDVGKRLGIGRAAYSNIENGHSLVSVEHLVKLVNILEQPIIYFFGLGSGDLSKSEVELLGFYRAIPDGVAREYILDMVKSAADHFRSD